MTIPGSVIKYCRGQTQPASHGVIQSAGRVLSFTNI